VQTDPQVYSRIITATGIRDATQCGVRLRENEVLLCRRMNGSQMSAIQLTSQFCIIESQRGVSRALITEIPKIHIADGTRETRLTGGCEFAYDIFLKVAVYVPPFAHLRLHCKAVGIRR